MLEVAGFPYPLGTNVRIGTAAVEDIDGEVVGFRGSRSLILPFDQTMRVATGARVVSPMAGATWSLAATHLLGRVIDAHGAPLDGRPQPVCHDHWPLAGPPSQSA